MKKPNVFLDFDDTTIWSHPVVIRFLNFYYGTVLPAEKYLCGNTLDQAVNEFLPADRKITRDELYEDYNRVFLTSNHWHSDIEPMDGAVEYIPQLAKKYNLWIVTARPENGGEIVRNLCQKFFGNHIAGFHFVWRRVGAQKFVVIKSKRQFIASVRGEKIAFFDDNPREVRDVQGVVPSYLFDSNGHHCDLEDLPNRVRSWQEIAETLL